MDRNENLVTEEVKGAKDEKRPLVSFVIPYYRTPVAWMREMLESVLPVALKYGNSEILLHDDGSEDAALSEAVSGYAERHPDLFRLSAMSPNCGISLSRQILVERARGKYLVSFDADDVMLDFDLASEVDYLEKSPEVGATYSLKYFFTEERKFSHVGAMPSSPFVSMFSMTAVPNGALMRRQAVMDCGGYANIAPGLGDDVILFSRLGERYRCELRMAPRVLGRRHAKSFGPKTDYVGYRGYSQDILARLLRRPVEGAMLENFQLPRLPDYQLLALAEGIFYLRQSQGDFALKFLQFLAPKFPRDYGLQNVYLKVLLMNRRFDEFDSYWQKLDTFGKNIPLEAAMWLAELAGVARQMGHPSPRLEEIAAVTGRYLAELPPAVAALLKK